MTVVVVGGGVAGLVAARTLAQSGVPVRVLEASGTFGGALRRLDLGGVGVDVGAEAFAVTRPETLTLVRDLGLADQVIRPRRSDARIMLESGLHALPPGLLGIPTDLSDPAVASIVGTTAVAEASTRDSRPLSEDLDPGITLGRLVRDRLGDAVAECLVAPVVGGVHAIDPDLVEADAVVPGLIRAVTAHGGLVAAAAALRSAAGAPGSAVAGLAGGMSTLVTGLVADLHDRGVSLQADTPVTALRSDGSGWTVRVADESIAATGVVIAVDAPRAASLLDGIPALVDVRDHLSAVRVGDVAVVAAVVRSDRLDEDPVGSGVLVAPGVAGVHAKAMTHATAKWDWIREAYGPGRHLVRLSYGRDGRIEEDLGALPEVARHDLELITGVAVPHLDDVRVVRWAHSLVHPRTGHRQNVSALRAAVAAHPTLALAGAGIGGNGLAGTIAQASTVADQLTGAALRP